MKFLKSGVCLINCKTSKPIFSIRIFFLLNVNYSYRNDNDDKDDNNEDSPFSASDIEC